MLELLVVVVIIGIVAVVTGTWYGVSQPAAVKGTVTSLVGILSEARTVAQSTGRSVTLTTTGGQANLAIAFPSQGDMNPPPVDQVFTTWRRDAAGKEVAKYSGIDNGTGWQVYSTSAPNPDPLTGGVTSISALFTNATAPVALFKAGTTDSSFSFDAKGRASRDFYIFVGGMRSGQSYPSAPVGLVLVSRTNGIHAFYKPNAGTAGVPWQRL